MPSNGCRISCILATIEDEDERVATGVMTAFLSGVILLLVRILNLRQVTDFFSRPVMDGFISAGGLLIMTCSKSRWATRHTRRRMFQFFKHVGESKPAALGLFKKRPQCATRHFPRTHHVLPGLLVVCIGGGIAGYLLGPKALKLAANVPGGFPPPDAPWYGFTSGLIVGGTILLNASTVSLVVFLSSIAMTKRLAIQRGEDINTKQELTGVGCASIVCGFFRTMRPTGGVSRTAVNLQNAHIQVPRRSLFSPRCTFRGTLYYLPRAALASIIIATSYSLPPM
ncbi:hypothetical protein BBJ28_00024918 [Nothophytophthora sp. Chile5]|nr:hypothetical protein BBJ28_00024918 [Nothophytophthora sp. Chile5]